MKCLELKKDFYYVGVIDHNLKVFDVAVKTEYGSSYNSYLLKTKEGNIVFEGNKELFENEYLGNLSSFGKLEEISYLFVTHTEPDHSGAISTLLEKNPNITIVASYGALTNLEKIIRRPFKKIVAKDGETLTIGDYHFRFISGIFLHWPDVMFTYIEELDALVCCDAFGAHYAEDDVLLSKNKDKEGYEKAFDYYFEKIMGPFPSFVKIAAKKVLALNPSLICTGHGPVIDCNQKERVERYITLADTLFPEPKADSVCIVLCSAYGYTRKMGETIKETMLKAGKTVTFYEIDALNYGELKDRIVHSMYESQLLLLGSPTVAGDAVCLFYDLLAAVPSTIGKGRSASCFGDYGWSGEAVGNLSARLLQLHYALIPGFKANFKMDEALKNGFVDYIETLLK